MMRVYCRTTFSAGAVLLVVLASAGCVVGPRYQKRPAPAAPQFKEETEVNSGDQTPFAAGGWWTVFHDEELNRLVQVADSGNQDVRAAIARVDQALCRDTCARLTHRLELFD